jgi:hypothetical protein
MTGILKEWVTTLGLRHQGILMSAIRGGDANAKDDPTKFLLRMYRDIILVSFDKQPSRFIEKVDFDMSVLKERMDNVLDSFDHYALHFILHIAYAAEIIGYKHPDDLTRELWKYFYETLVYKIHMNPENEEQMDARLNCDEATFASHDTRCKHH